MIKYGLMFIWLVLFIIGLNKSLELISAPDTISNINGVLCLVTIILLSISTKCLTVFIKEKKDD